MCKVVYSSPAAGLPIQAIACNLDTLLDAAIICELQNQGVAEFKLITASAEVTRYLQEYDIGVVNAREHRSLDRYVVGDEKIGNYSEAHHFPILDRYIIYGAIPSDVRAAYFDAAIDYWDRVLESDNISFVLFKKTPCLLYDFALYQSCQKKQIKTVIIEKTYWKDVLVLQTTIENPFCLKSVNPVNNIPSVRTEIGRFEKPYWTQRKFEKEGWEIKDTHLRRLRKRLTRLKMRVTGDQSRVRCGFYDGRYVSEKEVEKFSPLQRWNKGKRVLNAQRAIEREYHKSLHRFGDNLQKDFVVFFLQCEPEKNACPLGGVYSDQVSALELIRRWTPRRYDVLVKDHPSQFRRWHSLERGRGEGFYRRVVSTGCKLISHEIDNQSLFNRSLMNISITGTVIFEAWILGFKAAFMGYPWYALFNVPSVRSEHDLVGLLNAEKCEFDEATEISGLKRVGFHGQDVRVNEKQASDLRAIQANAVNIARAVEIYLAGE
jgi:hypothetical protein